MNNEIKILLTLYKEGGICKLADKVELRKGTLTLGDINSKCKKENANRIIKKFKYRIRPFVPVESQQKINMTVDAYNYMTSSECPEWFMDIKAWRKMNPKDRLELHLDRTAKHFGACRYKYYIVND